MDLPNELWIIIFSYLWPIDIVKIRLSCTKFNRLCLTDLCVFWVHWNYYQQLLGNINDPSMYDWYSDSLRKGYDFMTDTNKKCIKSYKNIIISILHGDLDRIKKYNFGIKINRRVHEWMIESSIRSENVDMINYIISLRPKRCKYIRDFMMMEAIDTNSAEVINTVRKYVKLHDLTVPRMIMHCAVNDQFILMRRIITALMVYDLNVCISRLHINLHAGDMYKDKIYKFIKSFEDIEIIEDA